MGQGSGLIGLIEQSAIISFPGMLVVHFSLRPPPRILLLILFLYSASYVGSYVVILSIGSISLTQMLIVTFGYATALYGEILLHGVAERLTIKRGEKWVKELDYIYLSLGSVGIIGAINRSDAVTDRITKADLFVPAITATAIVVRFIKTRAEISGWNRLPMPPDC